jgi:hypothetical protein
MAVYGCIRKQPATESIILPKVASNVHPLSFDMIQAVTLLVLLLTIPSYGEVPVRLKVVPAKVDDPTVAPHIPTLPRMSTMSRPTRRTNDLPVPNFLLDLKPVRLHLD